MTTETLSTAVTRQFGVKYPIFLAGMHIAASPRNCAAVTNAGGLGVVGALACKQPEQLDDLLSETRGHLKDPDNQAWGVDIVIPKVGGGARKTNHHYHQGDLFKYLDMIIKHKAKLVVTAVGAPSKEMCDYLHKHGIAVMSMIGDVKHVKSLLNSDGTSRVDLVCCQGGEGGGHTGSIPSSLLIPAVVDTVKGYKSRLTGKQIPVVAAGGMYCGRSLAAALAYGACAIWVGTRFVCSEESGAPLAHKLNVIKAGFHDTTRTLVYTGRPLRVLKTKFVKDWEENKQDKIKQLTSSGVIPYEYVLDQPNYSPPEQDVDDDKPYLMGETSALVTKIQPAAEIVNEIMHEAIAQIKALNKYQSKL